MNVNGVSFSNARLQEFSYNLLVEKVPSFHIVSILWIKCMQCSCSGLGEAANPIGHARWTARPSTLHTYLTRKRESNPMSSARQAVWLTTVLLAAQLISSFNS
ncbi:hypothetical protein T08_6580 [Trichinella sp. T8]|nr:hypothetical protein T08_6580 [Trichinella sp. T8]